MAADLVVNAQRYCEEIGLAETRQQVLLAEFHLVRNAEKLTLISLQSQIRRIQETLVTELSKRKFLFIKLDKAEFSANENNFGEDVRKAFPSAAEDVRESGNCLACELPTAAVFHLMRVAEYGLRALASDRRISLPKNKPIDLATWEELLRELEKAETAIQNYPRTEAREAQFEFFHGAMMELKRFKNKFRNRTMHNRESYDLDEAMSAFNHVKEFMRILSARISEEKRTPLIWKGNKWAK